MFLLQFISFIITVNATEVVYTHEAPPLIPVKIVKAEPQSYYLSPKAKFVFDLISANGSTHTLVCHEVDHRKPEVIRSYLIYSNIAHIQVRNFEFMGHQLCNDLATYIEAVFEFVTEEAPIYLELNTRKHQVEKVVLPNLNPYMDRIPEKDRQILNLLGKKR